MNNLTMKHEHILKSDDHLFNSKCMCKICFNAQDTPNPQISIDQKYFLLKSMKNFSLQPEIKDQSYAQGLQWYLRKLAFQSKTLPNFPILDTFVMEKGQLSFYIFFDNNKLKLHFNSLNFQSKSESKYSQTLPYSLNTLKQKFIQRKAFNDIEYEKAKYKQANPTFQYAQLDHDSEKLIKDFQKKVRYLDQILNRVVTLKQKNNKINDISLTMRNPSYRMRASGSVLSEEEQQQKVLSKYEFLNLFDKTRVKVCQMDQISYMQLFPIMYGQQQQSYVRRIKYFRQTESGKSLFKEAQRFLPSWLEKNQTLQRMQEQFLNKYFYSKEKLKKVEQFSKTQVKRLVSEVEQQYLMYQSYKLLLHLETETNIQISQCMLQFITTNKGATFCLKSIKYIKYFQKATINTSQNQLPTYKCIDKDDYIDDIQKQMRQMFENVSYQYQRLNQQWENFQSKTKNDRMHSNQVFKTVKIFEKQYFAANRKQNQNFQKLQNSKTSIYSTTKQENIKQDNQDEMNLHKILKSTDKKFKEQMLGLNKDVSKNLKQFKNTSKAKVGSKSIKS